MTTSDVIRECCARGWRISTAKTNGGDWVVMIWCVKLKHGRWRSVTQVGVDDAAFESALHLAIAAGGAA